MNESREKAEFEYFDGQEENESNYRRFNDWRNGYDSRDAEVEALREALRGWQSWFLGPASQGIDYIKPPLERTKAALSSGTQETK